MSKAKTTDNDSNDQQTDHYFYDSNGEMWVNTSAIKQNGGFELLPCDPSGEVPIDITQVRICTEYPQLQLVLTMDGQETLEKIFAE